MNYKKLLQSTMGKDSFLMVNKKIMAKYDVQFASFIAYVIDQEQYWVDTNGNDEFFVTNDDIHMYCGIKKGSINGIKKEIIKSELLYLETKGMPARTYYKVNHKKILEILSSDETRNQISFDSKIGKIDENTINLMSRDNLRLTCKKFGIKYRGNTLKSELIVAITDFLQLPRKVVTSYQEKWKQVTKKSGNEPKLDKPKLDKPKTIRKKNSYRYNSLETLKDFKGVTKSNISRYIETTNKLIESNAKYILENRDKFIDIDKVLYSSLKKGIRYNASNIAKAKEIEAKELKKESDVNLEVLEKLGLGAKKEETTDLRGQIIEEYKKINNNNLNLVVLRTLNLELKSKGLEIYEGMN